MFIESMYKLQIIKKKIYKKKNPQDNNKHFCLFILIYFILFIDKNRISVLHYLNRSKYFPLFFFFLRFIGQSMFKTIRNKINYALFWLEKSVRIETICVFRHVFAIW